MVGDGQSTGGSLISAAIGGGGAWGLRVFLAILEVGFDPRAREKINITEHIGISRERLLQNVVPTYKCNYQKYCKAGNFGFHHRGEILQPFGWRPDDDLPVFFLGFYG